MCPVISDRDVSARDKLQVSEKKSRLGIMVMVNYSIVMTIN